MSVSSLQALYSSPLDIEALLRSYPRVRPALSEAHQAIYVKEYRANRSGSGPLFGAIAYLERWMHRAVTASGTGPILELGAGTLNHLKFEPTTNGYDVVEPFRVLWENLPERSLVRSFYNDLSDVPTNGSYRHIVSIAVLEHAVDLPWMVARSATLLTEEGDFNAAFPSEGGLLWGLSWRLTTGLAYRIRTGLDYSIVMRHEHVNSADEILALIGYFFDEVELRRFPLPSKHLSFYSAASARHPKLDRCKRLIDERLRFSEQKKTLS